MSKTHLQQSQVSGSLSYSDSVSRADLFKANRSLADDLNSLRTQVKGILGEETWMSAQAIDLHNLKAQLTGSLIANNIAASGVVDAGTLYSAGAAGISGSLTVAGAAALQSGLNVTGAISGSGALQAGGALTVAGASVLNSGLTVNAAVADFNAGVTANEIKIDGDTAQRLYIVGASGELKDEANMIFDGSALKVTGAVSGSGALSAGGALTVAGASVLNNGLTVNAAVADFNAGVTANSIKIDSDVAQRLYIVDSDGSIKDEANMIFDGSALKVTGAMSGSGALSAGGALTVAGASALNGALDVAGVTHLNNSTYVAGTFYVTGGMDVSGSALFRNGLEIAGDSLEITGSFGVSGSTTLDGSVKLVGDVAQRLYIVGADGAIKDEANLIFNGSKLFVTGALDVSGNANIGGSLTIAGMTVNTAAADFNAGVTANEIKIDGDVAQRLYIVGASGELKDEANMIFDGSALKVTGAVSGSGAFSAGGALTVAGAADLNGALDVAGQVDLAAVGVATNVRGLLNVAGVADFNGGVTANEIKIDGDQAQRLYIVDSDGSLKDEAKLVFDGSELAVDADLAVTGDAIIAGNVQVDGDLRVKGTMTYIDTANMRVQDAFIYLATGSLGTTDSGIVLHGGAGVGLDLVIGQDGGAGEFIFGKGNRAPDGDGAMDGIDLVPAWMSEIKLGTQEGLFSGSIALSGSDLKVKSAEGALKLISFGDEEFSLAAANEMSSFQTQFGSSTSLVGAILSAAGAGGASSFRKGKKMGTDVTAQFGGSLDFSSIGSLRTTGDAASGMDVYLNGVLLSQSDDYTVSAVDQIDFVAGFRVEADDIVTVVLRNAAL